MKIGGRYLSIGSGWEQIPCEGVKDLNNRMLLWLLSVTCWVRLSLNVDVSRGILRWLPSVEGPDVRQFTVQILVSLASSSLSFQCLCFVDQMRLV